MISSNVPDGITSSNMFDEIIYFDDGAIVYCDMVVSSSIHGFVFIHYTYPSPFFSFSILKEGIIGSTIPSSLFPIGLVPSYPIFCIMRNLFSYCFVGNLIFCTSFY